jgi:hypothetical protein
MLESVTELSIADLIKAALVDEIPALQIVKPAHPWQQGGVLILLLHPEAIKDLSPVLKAFALRHGNPETNVSLEIRTDQPAGAVFQWLKAKKQKWSWGQLALTQPRAMTILVCAYTGNSICKQITRYLARMGVRTVMT